MIKTNDDIKHRIANEVDGLEDAFDDLATNDLDPHLDDEEQQAQWEAMKVGIDHEFLMQFLGYHSWVASGMPRDTPWDEIRHQLHIINTQY